MKKVLFLLAVGLLHGQALLSITSGVPAPTGGTTPISVISHAVGQSSGGTSATTGATDTSGANRIVVGVTLFSAGTDPALVVTSLMDSKGNSYTLIRDDLNNLGWSLLNTLVYECLNPTVGGMHTITVSTNSGFPSIAYLALANTNATDSAESLDGVSTTGSTLSTGTFTPAHNNEIMISVLANGDNGVAGVPLNSFTASDSLTNVSGNAVGIGMSYLIQTTATATATGWDISPSVNILTISFISVPN